MPEQTYSTDHEREAYALGVSAAKAAASWIFDGNTKTEVIPQVLALMDDGDPRADDYLPARPNLSGEWADPTPVSLYREITGDTDGPSDETADDVSQAIADAWEAGVSDTFGVECKRILRTALRVENEGN